MALKLFILFALVVASQLLALAIPTRDSFLCSAIERRDGPAIEGRAVAASPKSRPLSGVHRRETTTLPTSTATPIPIMTQAASHEERGLSGVARRTGGLSPLPDRRRDTFATAEVRGLSGVRERDFTINPTATPVNGPKTIEKRERKLSGVARRDDATATADGLSGVASGTVTVEGLSGVARREATADGLSGVARPTITVEGLSGVARRGDATAIVEGLSGVARRGGPTPTPSLNVIDLVVEEERKLSGVA